MRDFNSVFHLEEVTIEEPSNDVKYDKVIVEPISNTHKESKLSDELNKKIHLLSSYMIEQQGVSSDFSSGNVGLLRLVRLRVSGNSSSILPASVEKASLTF